MKKVNTKQKINNQVSLPRANPFTDGQGPANVIQSARRKLQSSQLPVRASVTKRSEQQTKMTTLKKFSAPIGSVKRNPANKNPEDQKVVDNNRKSISMVDLSPASTNDLPVKRAVNRSNSARMSDSRKRNSNSKMTINTKSWTTIGSRREETDVERQRSKAISVVCRVLAINVWRRSREEVAELRMVLTNRNQQLENVQLQIEVLRQLLNKQNVRTAGMAGDFHRAKIQVEQLTKERNQLAIEKESAEGEVQKLREISEERLVSVENLRNELRSLRDQLTVLDTKMLNDREKLLKFRVDMKLLIDKLEATEALANERAARAEQAANALDDAQMQLAKQITLATSLQEEVHRLSNLLKEKEKDKVDLEYYLRETKNENLKTQEELRITEETKCELVSKLADLEEQFLNQESLLKQYEATNNLQMLELNELRERLIRQVEQNTWSSKIFQLAESFMRLPRLIFRSLSLSFSSTGSPPKL